jgi:hypothetical protein
MAAFSNFGKPGPVGVDPTTLQPGTVPLRGAGLTRSHLDFVAPGRNITSTWPVFLGRPKNLNTLDGTSQAAAHVAGLIAMLLDRNNIIGFQDRNFLGGRIALLTFFPTFPPPQRNISSIGFRVTLGQTDYDPPVTREQAMGRLTEFGVEPILDLWHPGYGLCTLPIVCPGCRPLAASAGYFMPNFFTNP